MKSLKTYLSKAEYIMIVNRILKKAGQEENATKYRGVKIPTINFRNNFTKAIKDLKAINISPLDDSLGKEKALAVAKITNNVSQKQDLHFLHFGIIYYSARNEENKTVQGWKIPKIIGITKQLEYVRKQPEIESNGEFIAKFSKLKP